MVTTSGIISKASRTLSATPSSSTRAPRPQPCAGRIGNGTTLWRSQGQRAEGWILPLVPFHWALVDNLKRDPFEQAVGSDVQSAFWIGGSLGAPMSALQY